MDLFVRADTKDKMSLAIELFTIYVRASQRNIVTLNSLSESALTALKLEQVPVLVKTVTEVVEGKEVTSQY